MNPVPPMKELNAICQKPRYKEVGNWMVRRILRDAALPVTRLLLQYTGVTANQVTLASLGVALLGIACLAFPSAAFFLAGAALLQLWYYLDHVDGQIARYRGTASLSGRFFDFMTHHVVHGSLFFGLFLYGYSAAGSIFYPVWGFIASLAMIQFNLLQDTKYKTFFEKLAAWGKIEALREEPAAPASSVPATGWKKRAFSLLHKSAEIHVVMNVLTAAAVLQALFHLSFDLRGPLMLYYGLAVPLISGVKNYHVIAHRKIDEEFEHTFREIRL
ncbi:MAG: CDP-alcohol phosphatidyltransferase family protein [Candidatus Omnitrophica bacterium]|nr:CDP-alcohol phosphatidyltransferase family protein [Candidatus Omnitrophota bacterium]